MRGEADATVGEDEEFFLKNQLRRAKPKQTEDETVSTVYRRSIFLGSTITVVAGNLDPRAVETVSTSRLSKALSRVLEAGTRQPRARLGRRVASRDELRDHGSSRRPDSLRAGAASPARLSSPPRLPSGARRRLLLLSLIHI